MARTRKRTVSRRPKARPRKRSKSRAVATRRRRRSVPKTMGRRRTVRRNPRSIFEGEAFKGALWTGAGAGVGMGINMSKWGQDVAAKLPGDFRPSTYAGGTTLAVATGLKSTRRKNAVFLGVGMFLPGFMDWAGQKMAEWMSNDSASGSSTESKASKVTAGKQWEIRRTAGGRKRSSNGDPSNYAK